jgi:serine/threonine protein kinase
VQQEPVIQALVEVARRRGLLGREPGRRLARYATDRHVHSLSDLRSWLANADGINPDLARRLTTLLAPAELPAFGDYRALAHLADGGMGRVWLAAGPSGALVVVKTLKKSSSSDALVAKERIQRFEREARITRQLAHPNIVRCLNSGHQDDGTLYLVLEYVESGDLRDLVTHRQCLPEPLSLAIMYQVADALAEADRLKLVHRDLKPSNIFVTKDGNALLADFGIARSTEADRTELTMAGAIIGSPQYMSPEQILGRDVLDIRSDLYSLGAVLYFCLTGRLLFDGKVQDIMHLHCEVPPPDVRTAKPEVSEGTAMLINHCLAKRREDRPASPALLRTAIEDALKARGVTMSQAIEEETRREERQRADAPTQHGTIFGSDSGEATIVSDLSGMALDGGEHTLVADLSGRELPPLVVELTTHTHANNAKTASAIRTFTASMLASEVTPPAAEEKPAVKTRSGESGTGSGTDVVEDKPASQVLSENFVGDAAEAMGGDWISLLPEGEGDPTAVMLFARTKLILGKLKDPPVDICLRNYPVETHKDALQRISRQHLQLHYDRLQQQCVAEDLGGTNGTQLDGTPLAKGQPRELIGKNAHVVVAASAVSLWIRCRKARKGGQVVVLGGFPPAIDAACGIETDHLHDAVIISRPENRPEMAYAMVLRQVSIGGPGSDLALVGARSLAAVVIARYAGRWVWRTASSETWQPLRERQTLDCGGRLLIAQVGQYSQF